MTPDDLRYTEDHEWARETADGVVRVGITDHAQRQLGDVVLVELPTLGDTVAAGDACGTVVHEVGLGDLPPVAARSSRERGAGDERSWSPGALRRQLDVRTRPVEPGSSTGCSTPPLRPADEDD
jgi:hypothetical protein